MREKLIDLLSVDLSGSDGYEPELIADHLIANGVVISNSETTTKWIPVTERLPEHFSYVLLWDSLDKDCFMGVLRDDGEWYVPGYQGALFLITHWMPLPEPPKGE
jgi:hypothetical protein